MATGKFVGGRTSIVKAVATSGGLLTAYPSKQIIQDPFSELTSYGGAIP